MIMVSSYGAHAANVGQAILGLDVGGVPGGFQWRGCSAYRGSPSLRSKKAPPPGAGACLDCMRG